MCLLAFLDELGGRVHLRHLGGELALGLEFCVKSMSTWRFDVVSVFRRFRARALAEAFLLDVGLDLIPCVFHRLGKSFLNRMSHVTLRVKRMLRGRSCPVLTAELFEMSEVWMRRARESSLGFFSRCR